jgi:hypothetical protein
MTILRDHPYWHVRSLLMMQPTIAELTISYYCYVPQTIEDQRMLVRLARDDFLSEAYMTTLLANARQQQEVALHSVVTLQSGAQRHIPMIDMATSAKAHLGKLAAFVDPAQFGELVWFNSGRSFHGYGTKLLSNEQWIRLMGILLLSNQKDLKPIVDPRWIGHRLLAGYSALRWSKNTDFYLSLPSRLAPLTAPVLAQGSTVLEVA